MFILLLIFIISVSYPLSSNRLVIYRMSNLTCSLFWIGRTEKRELQFSLGRLTQDQIFYFNLCVLKIKEINGLRFVKHTVSFEYYLTQLVFVGKQSTDYSVLL